jgi:cytochrome c-type biogenesis protein CcmH
MKWRHAWLTALVLVTLAGGAAAQAPADVGAEADRLFNRVMSPYCPGKLLAACGSGQADTLRQEIRRELAAGKPADAIEAELYYKFGDSIRSEPKKSGVGLLAWVIPAVVLFATAAWLVLWLRRVGQPRQEPAAIAPPASRELIGRLDDELLDMN